MYDKDKKSTQADTSFGNSMSRDDLNISAIQQRSNSVEGTIALLINLAEIKRNYKDVESADKAPFGSNSPRFMFKKVFYGEDLKLTPGPGYYTKPSE